MKTYPAHIWKEENNSLELVILFLKCYTFRYLCSLKSDRHQSPLDDAILSSYT